MNKLLKQALLICVCLFALTGQAMAISPAIQIEPVAGSLLDAERAYAEGNFEKAAKIYRSLAEQGDAEAQLILGSMYDIGLGGPQNYIEAVKWYRMAAEQGNARAQSKLGSMYDIGLGVSQDYIEAIKWWRMAAEQGDDVAQLSLGRVYDHGRGVPKDFKEAVEWYRLAAEQGNVFAQEKLAWKYILGEGVAQDDVLAHMWLSIAISNDSTPGRKAANHQRIQQRDALARRMTAEQIAKAREFARKCTANKFKGC
ncbi:MAG: sel1 repeat family protein [Betaproteobacteria bacterium]|nr:sel1 repeat family protein [Betaproteobacteria bacterium]